MKKFLNLSLLMVIFIPIIKDIQSEPSILNQFSLAPQTECVTTKINLDHITVTPLPNVKENRDTAEIWSIQEGEHHYTVTIHYKAKEHLDHFFSKTDRIEFLKKLAHFNSFLNIRGHGFLPITDILIRPDNDSYDCLFHRLKLSDPSTLTHEMGHALFYLISPGMFKKELYLVGGLPVNLLKEQDIPEELKKIFCIFLIRQRYISIQDESFNRTPHSGHPYDSLSEFIASAFNAYHDYPDELTQMISGSHDPELQNALKILFGYLGATFEPMARNRNLLHTDWLELLESFPDETLLGELIDEYIQTEKRCKDYKEKSTPEARIESLEYHILCHQKSSVSNGIMYYVKKFGLNKVISLISQYDEKDRTERLQILADLFDFKTDISPKDLASQLESHNPLHVALLREMSPYLISYIMDEMRRMKKDPEAEIIFRSLPLRTRIQVDLVTQSHKHRKPSLIRAVIASV